MRYLAIPLCLILLSGNAFAEEMNVVLWNGKDLIDVNAVNARVDDIRSLATATQLDILLIDEVCSLDVVDRVREIVEQQLGESAGTFHAYCSDFEQNDGGGRNAFEVGIISRFPADAVVELDPTPDNKFYGRDGEPEEMPLDVTPLLKLGVKRTGTERGVLWARFDEPKLTVCVTHLKSSYMTATGEDDHRNSQKREYVAAAMALSVLRDKELFPDYAHAVIGDLNVGATDETKIGNDLDEDTFDGSGDGYDDTHYLLREIAGMTCLTKSIGETYDDPRFAGSGPIDNIYVTSSHAEEFANTGKTNQTFGSDHFAVFTRYQVSH